MNKNKKGTYFVCALFLLFCIFPVGVYGYTKTYNMHAFDMKTLFFLNLKVAFTDNETADTTDNQTISGSLDFTVFDRSFESSEGFYVQTGDFFNGLWSATETKHSAYYETTINTFFNYSIYGLFLLDEFLAAGFFYGEQVTKKKDGKIIEELFYAGPFIGVAVSFSE